MSGYVHLKSQKLAEGVCQQCGNRFEELHYATLTSGNRTKSYVLCNGCLMRLRERVVQNNAGCTAVQPGVDRMNGNEAAQNAGMPEAGKRPKKRKPNRKTIIIACIAFILVVAVAALAVWLSSGEYKRLLPAQNISFAEFKSEALASAQRLEKYHKKFGFYFTLTEAPEFHGSNELHGIICDSYKNEWGEDTYYDWRLDFKDTDDLIVGQTYYIEGILYYSVHRWLDMDDEIWPGISHIKIKDAPRLGIKTDNFAIEGKWKNVGETSCAQMQPGSITVFNGTNCNVYSPSDTYAFYETNGEYHLDCTSFFAGDSMCFIVRILDNDNIVLDYDEETQVRLQRVG